MRFDTLDDWLRWQESLSPAEIDLGLARVSRVLSRAGLEPRFDCPLITVAGTNGKGSVVAMLEALALSSGLKVASYTSPHLFSYNERIRIDAQPVSDAQLCEAFERIDQARGDDRLTYFEFGTLAAIVLFFQQQPDLVILEVGLGGRLDAVNVMDADISVLTSVAIDHTDWLGDDREAIGYEKAGVFRAGKTVVCGDARPPQSVIAHARKLHCRLLQAGSDYDVSRQEDGRWMLQSPYRNLDDLPPPALAGDFQYRNTASAVLALQALAAEERLPEITHEAIRQGIGRAVLPGRFQRISGQPVVYVDVAHNLQAAQALAQTLADTRIEKTAEGEGRTLALVAMLADKDIAGVLSALASQVDQWCFAGLPQVSRGLAIEELVGQIPEEILPAINRPREHDFSRNPCKMPEDRASSAMFCRTVTTACEHLSGLVARNTRIIVFGSFYTVAEAMQAFSSTESNNGVRN